MLALLHLVAVHFDEVAAVATGVLLAATRTHGLSLCGRAYLALAAGRGATVFATDWEWRGTSQLVGVTVEMLR